MSHERLHNVQCHFLRFFILTGWVQFSFQPFSSNSVKADVQFPGGQEDNVANVEEKPKGLHSCSFRDVRDLSDSQALLKSESSIDMVTILTPYILVLKCLDCALIKSAYR